MRKALFLAALLSLAGCAPEAADTQHLAAATTLGDAIDRAAAQYQVPRDILLAVSYAEGRWIDPGIPTEENGQPGSPHAGIEIGPLHLRRGMGLDTVRRALELLHVDEATLRANLGLQVAGAAAVLADLGRETGARADDVDSWAEAVARYSGLAGRDAQVGYARYVWEALRQGRREQAFTGETLLLQGRNGPAIETLLNAEQVAQFSADYPPARWVPASSSNYTVGRGGNPITHIVIHTMQGSYAGAISWFQNPSAGASAHYLLRSSDGEVTQMVDDQNTAWHAGNWYYNQHSIGIEHEGYVMDPARWYTETMYVASARLTRYLCDRYRVPIDRTHIIGHYQVPVSGSGAPCSTTATTCGGSGRHTDPGNGGTAWNWDHYMDLVRGGGTVMPMYAARLGTISYPRDMMSGERAVAYVEYTNTGTAGWDTTNTRLGTTQPRDHAGRFYDMVNWLSRNRPTAVDRATAPGAVGRFSFVITAPTVTSDTTVTESFGLVQEGVTWFGPADDAVTFTVRVHAPVTPPPADAGVRDAGPSPAMDAGVTPDAGDPDAGTSEDTGPSTEDAGTLPASDAGPEAAAPRADASRADASRDGGTGGTPRGGCGCSTPGTGSRRAPALALASLSLLAFRRRRRTR